MALHRDTIRPKARTALLGKILIRGALVSALRETIRLKVRMARPVKIRMRALEHREAIRLRSRMEHPRLVDLGMCGLTATPTPTVPL
jgi:hypothetical protein